MEKKESLHSRESKARLERDREMEAQAAMESWCCVFETLTHLLAHRALTHLNLLPRVFGEL